MPSRIHYYPNASGDDLETIDLGVFASDVQETIIRDATVVVSGTGRYTNVLHGARAQVRIIVELGNDEATAEKCQTFEYFAKEGHTFGFAFDRAYTYVVDGLPPRGATKLTVGTNVVGAWAGAAISANESVVVMSPLLSYIREHNVVTAVTGTVLTGRSLTLSRPIQRTFLDGPVLVRHKWFFPALMLAPDARTRPMVTHDHGFVWTLDMTCWEDVYALSLFDSVAFGTSVTGSIGDAYGGEGFTGGGSGSSGFTAGGSGSI